MKPSRSRPRQRIFCLLNNFIINPLYLFVKNNLLILIDLLGKKFDGKAFRFNKTIKNRHDPYIQDHARFFYWCQTLHAALSVV